MDGELLCKVIQGIKAVAGVKAFLVLSVAALHFPVVAGGVRTNQFVADAKLGGSFLK